MVMGSIPTGDVITGLQRHTLHTLHEGDVPVLQHDGHVSASGMVAARALKKGF